MDATFILYVPQGMLGQTITMHNVTDITMHHVTKLRQPQTEKLNRQQHWHFKNYTATCSAFGQKKLYFAIKLNLSIDRLLLSRDQVCKYCVYICCRCCLLGPACLITVVTMLLLIADIKFILVWILFRD